MALTSNRAEARLDQLFDSVGHAEVIPVDFGRIRQDAEAEGYRRRRVRATSVAERRHTPWPETLATAAGSSSPWRGHLPAGHADRREHCRLSRRLHRLSPFGLAMAVVYCTDQATPFGPTYGTAPGRSERGGWSCHIGSDDQAGVNFHIVAISRPHDLATGLAGPSRPPSNPFGGDEPLRSSINGM